MSGRVRIGLFLVGYALINWGVWRLLQSDSRADDPPEKVQGFSARVLEDLDGSRHRYIVFVPYRRVSNELLPVIVYLNGQGENGDDGLMQMFDNLGQPVWDTKRSFPFAVFAPQCPREETWRPDGPAFQRALRMLDRVIEQVNGDADRVYLTGDSSAGGAIWEIARRYPERFAAIVPVAAAKPAGSPQAVAESLAGAGMPIWSSYNRYDADKFVAPNRAMKEALLEAGASPLYFENDAERHDSWSRTYRSPALYQWLLEQRVSTRSRVRFTPHSPGQLLNDFRLSGSAPWTTMAEGIAAPVTGDLDSSLLSDSVYEGIELHAEFKSDLRSICGLVIHSANVDDDPPSDCTVLLCGPAAGSGDLLVADQWRAALDPLAQRALLPNDWNDVRLRLVGGRLTLQLNGWPALDVQDPRFSGPVRIGFLQRSHSASPAEWRFVRLRPVAAGEEAV